MRRGCRAARRHPRPRDRDHVAHPRKRGLQVAAGKLQELLDLLGRSINRLGELVNDILDVSRIDRGIFQIQPQRIELSALVRDIVGAFESAQHSIQITVQQGDAIYVADDPARLRQCLERHALVEVIDEGPGIPPGKGARFILSLPALPG